MINNAINLLISGNNLSETEAKEVFDEILSGLADEIQTAAFVTALKIKGESTDEIASMVLASKESVKGYSFLENASLIENTVFNYPDDFIDISFAVDIICSACNLGVVKFAFDSHLDSKRSFLTLKDFCKNADFSFKQDNFEKTNFAYIKISPAEPYFKYTKEISRKLCFKNIFNITDLLLNPYDAKNLFLGVNSRDDVEKYANICLKLNYLNSIVLSGVNNFPFASIEGETYVAEAWKNKIFTYVLTPELVGLKAASIDEIKYGNSSSEILRDIFKNKIKNACYDIIILNAALALYIAKKADSIMDGITLAKRTIDSGLACEKLEQIIALYN